MKKAIALVLALMLTFALCACGESSDSDTDIVNHLNGDIQKIAHSTDEKEGGETPNKDKGSSINWDDLLKVNKEIVGWIRINDTKINYPVLWHKDDNANNQFYPRRILTEVSFSTTAVQTARTAKTLFCTVTT